VKSTSCVNFGTTASRNLAFSKRYVEAKTEFGFVLEVGGSPAFIGHQFVAIFKRKHSLGGQSELPERRGQMLQAGRRKSIQDAEIPIGGGNRDEEAVFVGDIDSVQTPEGIIPSFVRLEAADEFYRRCAHALDFSGSKIGLARTYWERSVVAGRPAVLTDQGVSEKVESRAQIVDAIANYGSPLDRDGLEFAKAVDFVTRLRIFIHNDGVRLSAYESPDGCIKVRKMLFGPVNLYADIA
jgi:hypothetical protein